MNYGQAYSPPCQGGVAAPSTKWSRSEEARTGWSITSYVSQCVLQPIVWLTILYVSRCRAHAARPSTALRWLRDFLLMPQPPLLGKEGNALDSNSFTPSMSARSSWNQRNTGGHRPRLQQSSARNSRVSRQKPATTTS